MNFGQYGHMTSTARKKQSQEETGMCRKSEVRRSEMEKVRREEMQVCGMVGKSRKRVFFQCCGSGGSKSRLVKAAGAETSGQMRNEALYAGVARSRF